MTTNETTRDELRSLAKRTLQTDGLCPVCSGFGLETPSEIGPEAEYASIDVGNTERVGGVLCACCREQGVHLAGE
jgi:hypothetical protein